MRKECQGIAPVETCDEIENEKQKNMCKLNIARTNGDIKICDKFEDSDYAQACIAIVGINKNDESYCDKVDDEYLRGQCRTKLAMQKNDSAICKEIKNVDSKDLCYSYFILDEKSVSEKMCSQISELFLREMCEMSLAIKNKDEQRCLDPKIVSYENQAICLAGIGMKHGDAEMCGKIDITRGEDEFEEGLSAGEIMRDLCYAGVAKKNTDDSFCKKIKDSKLKKACKENASKKEDEKDAKDESVETEESASSNIPPLPDWMECPVPENAKLHVWGNNFGSGFKYTDPNDESKTIGPIIRYSKPNFEEAHLLFCYNALGEKHGAFKEYDKETGTLRREGRYKNGKWDQLNIQYIKGAIRSKIMYDEGVMQGSGEDYCTAGACGKGSLVAKGQYVNDKKQGTWNYYKNGKLTSTGTYDKGYNISK
jgi:hypothetical protein